MKKLKKFIAMALLLGIAFFVGGILGFYKGFFLGQAAEALESSASTVLTLTDLHKNDVQQALARLDERLDGQVVLGEKLGVRSLFDVMGFASNTKTHTDFIAMIAKHRQTYPRINSKEPTPGLLEMQRFVDTTLQNSRDAGSHR